MTTTDSNGHNGNGGRNDSNQLTLFEPVYNQSGEIIAWIRSDVGNPNDFRMVSQEQLDRELDQGQQQ